MNISKKKIIIIKNKNQSQDKNQNKNKEGREEGIQEKDSLLLLLLLSRRIRPWLRITQTKRQRRP